MGTCSSANYNTTDTKPDYNNNRETEKNKRKQKLIS